MSDAETIGLLPQTWTSVTLADLLDRLQYGYTAKASAEKDGPRFLRITDITDEGITWHSVPGCAISTADLKKYRVADGDIVFARTGSIEKARLVRNPPEAVFASYLIRGRPLLQEIGPWLGYFVRSSGYVSQAVAASAGIGRPNVNAKSLGRFTLPLAPLPEQHRIVEAIESYFTRLDAAVATLERVRANLKRYRASVLKAAVEGRLVPTEAELAHREGREYEPASVLLERILKERRRRWEEADVAKLKTKGEVPKGDGWKRRYREPVAPNTSNLPQLPEGWCWATWEQVGFSQNGRAFPSAEYQPEGVRLLRPGNLDESGRVEWTDANTRHMPQKWAEDCPNFLVGPGEIVMNLTAQSLKDEFLGRACMTGGTERCLLNQRIARLTPVSLDSRYVLWVFKAGVFRRFVAALNTGSLIQHMFTSQLADFVFPVPPRAEQARISSEVDRLISYLDELEQLIGLGLTRCRTMRQSVLKWAFEGKLVDQDPADEAASVLLERVKAEREKAQSVDKKTPRGSRKRKTA